MAIVSLTYADWKAQVNSLSLQPYHIVNNQAVSVRAIAGTPTNQIQAAATNEFGTDYDDWNTNFSGTSIEVDSVEEAILQIEIADTGQASPLNTLVRTVQADASGKNLRYDTLGKLDLARSTEDYTTVYEITERSIFCKMVFQLNSDNIDFQVEVDGQDIFTTPITFEDLESLSLGSTSGGSYTAPSVQGQEFGIFQYASNKWIWQPPSCFLVESNLKIKMRSSNNSSSRDFTRGYVIRRIV